MPMTADILNAMHFGFNSPAFYAKPHAEFSALFTQLGLQLILLFN